MDVSSLLNAAPAKGNVHREVQHRSPASPKRSSSSTPTPASVHHAEASSRLVGVEDRDAVSPLPLRSGMRVLDSDAYGQRLTDMKLNSVHRSTNRDDGQRIDVDDGAYLHQRLAESRLHRFSDSLSSVSSYDSTPSQPHSRTSSVTTVGDDNVASVSYVDAFEDTKLATVQEETGLRAQEKKKGHRETRRPSRPSLVINTDTSNGRASRRRRHSKTLSSATNRGARSSGGLPDCSLPPTAYGSSSSYSSSRHGFTWHARAASAPGFDSNERPDSGNRTAYTLLQRRRLSTMDRSHGRTDSLDEDDDNPMYLSEPGSPVAAAPDPSGASHEPTTPPRSSSHAHSSTPNSHADSSTPNSAASTNSPFVHSAPNSDAALTRPAPVPTTPIRASRTRTENEASSSSSELDRPCFAQEGCMENSVSRKAISHFFGRNKRCTLAIPNEVWISICRKHYQRTRYRNNDTYPLYQIDLILKQLEKIARWERSYTDNGRPSPIRSWTISFRRRQNQSNAVAIPAWLQDVAGPGHTTDSVRRVAQRIEQELERGAYNDIPEIEFLPDIPSGSSNSPARRERKQHARRASSLSLSFTANPSRAPPSNNNSGGRGPARPLESRRDSYYRTSQRQAGRSGEPTSQNTRSFAADHQAAIEKMEALLSLPEDWQESAYRPNGPPFNNNMGRPPTNDNSMPPPNTVPRQPGPSPLSGSSGFRYPGSNNPVGQSPGHPRPPSSHNSPYTGYGPFRGSTFDGQPIGGQLPSFSSGFGSAFDTTTQGQRSDPYTMGAVRPDQSLPEQNLYSQPSSDRDSYLPTHTPGRNDSSYTSPFVEGHPRAPPVPDNSRVSWDERLNSSYPMPTYRGETNFYGTPTSSVGNSFYRSDNVVYNSMAEHLTRRRAYATPSTSTYGPTRPSRFLSHDTSQFLSHDASGQVLDPALIGAAQHHQQSMSAYGPSRPSRFLNHDNSGQVYDPALTGSPQPHQQSSYSPWTTSMRTSTPQAAAANPHGRVPQVDMNGDFALTGPAQHHEQSSYNPWTTSMRTSTPQDATANTDDRAPQADMDEDPAAKK